MIVALLASALAAPTTDFTFAAKTRPAGAALFGSLSWHPSDTVAIGPNVGVYFYWYELNAQTRITLLDGFIVGTLQGGPEPGAFLRADDPEGDRQFMLRPLVRGRVEVNLRNDLLWLYIRNTAWTRHRSFAEYNPFQDKVFPQGGEFSFEHSTALMVSPSGTAERKAWLYAEVTLETSARGVGWLDRMVRGGLILEKITPSLSADLDFYYSTMPTKIGGPGALLVLWWTPGAGKRSER